MLLLLEEEADWRKSDKDKQKMVPKLDETQNEHSHSLKVKVIPFLQKDTKSKANKR